MVRNLLRKKKSPMSDFIKTCRQNQTVGVAAYFDKEQCGVACGGVCTRFEDVAILAATIIYHFAKEYGIPQNQAVSMVMSALKICRPSEVSKDETD